MTTRRLEDALAANRREYAQHGVTCLRGLFDAARVASLAAASRDVIERPLEHGNAGYMQGPMTAVNFLYRRPGPFRDFVFGSPAGEIIGRVIGSGTIRMYHDYLFSKQPCCEKVVPWHTDGGGYALQGEMMPNLWVALTPANAANGRLEFIGGFHRGPVARRWSERREVEGPSEPLLPDFEDPAEPATRRYPRLAWDLAPGDAVLFHPYTPHHSKANRSPTTRTGYALRVVGDDVRWCLAKSQWLRVPGFRYESVADGTPVTQDDFPVMWRDAAAAAA
ncbi:MAG: phytanoyl-CoA dioxygenase family protein [Steroidobacteraceae bacterium]|jgi:ectoine hydroxylase-related dioxygenase (phytanoyl-CoA dioxygenase family)|nr:phytanoyl-CoA dioxygenase family protein [Steroidobacteraceae bacterium]